MPDPTEVVPIRELANTHIGKQVTLSGFITKQSQNLFFKESPESADGRIPVSIKLSGIDSKHEGSYALLKGTLKSEEPATILTTTLEVDSNKIYSRENTKDDLSIRKIADEVFNTLQKYDFGVGIPKRYVVEEIKGKGASEEKIIETIQRLQVNGEILEPSRGFIARMH